MTFVRPPVLPVLILSLAAAGGLAQQPNSPGASLSFCGVDGPAYPMTVTVFAGANPEVQIRMAGGPQRPFILARAPAGIASPGTATTLGLFDLNPALGLDVVMDGLAFSTGSFLDFLANTGTSGSMVMTFPVPPGLSLDAGAFQAAVLNPGSPAGLTLTAATLLEITPAAPVAFYVSRSTGSASGAGTPTSPFLTIAQGIAASVAAGLPRRPVFVAHTLAGGLYTDVMTLSDGVSLIGGFDPLTWAPVPGAFSRNIFGPGGSVSASGIHSLTTIANFEFQGGAATAPNFTAVSLRCLDCTLALTFINCRFDSGNSVAGATGAAGTVGANGANGGSGSGTASGSGGGLVSSPVRGGQGGGGFFGNGGDGFDGFPTSQPAPFGNGGNGGIFTGNTDGGNGSGGAAGVTGAHGVPAVAGGAISGSGIWNPGLGGLNGLAGAAGGGGGGGGGGAGHDPLIGTSLAGGGGGGGGQGGGSGGGGAAGANGGASFGAYLHDSSPVFIGCRFRAGLGGAGGTGGNGVAGGNGGNGGAGASGQSGTINQAGDGGNGGPGGDGGAGGGGPGGAGGPSFCVYRAGTSQPTIVNPTFLPSQGGAGGPGGLAGGSLSSFAPNGPNGPGGIVF